MPCAIILLAESSFQMFCSFLGVASRDLLRRRRRNKPDKDEIPMFIRVDPSTLPSPPPGESGFALPPQEEIDRFVQAPRSAIFGNCTIETEASAEAFDKAVETVAIATSESFADLDADCGTATAKAEVNANFAIRAWC